MTTHSFFTSSFFTSMMTGMTGLILSLAAPMAHATPANEANETFMAASACSNVVTMDQDNVYLGFGPYLSNMNGPRRATPAWIDILPIQNTPGTGAKLRQLKTLDSVADLVVNGRTLYALTYSGLEEWDIATGERMGLHKTLMNGTARYYREHSTGLAQAGDLLVISHGRLGLSLFDTKSRRIVHQENLIPEQLPLESQAVDVAVSDSMAFIVLDNFSLVKQGPPPFRGIVVFDLNTRRVVKALPGLDPGAETIAIVGDDVLIGYGGPTWKFSLKDILNGTELRSQRYVWKYGIEGHPIGKPSVDQKTIATCFLKSPEKAGAGFKKVPAVFNRAELMLD